MATATKTATPGNARSEVKSDSGLKGILDAFRSGGDMDDAAADADAEADIDESEGARGGVEEDENDPSIVHSGRAEDDGDDEDVVDTEEGESSSEEPAEEAGDEDGASSQPKGEGEKFWVTDAKGRREVAVNWQDKRTRQRLVGAAYGYHHEVTKRGAAEKALADYKQETSSVVENYKKLDAAWQREGLAGLVPLLTGGKQTIRDLVKQAKEEEERIAKMSPAEQVAHMEKLARERSDRELAEFRRQVEAEKASAREAAETAEAQTFQSSLERAFEKHSGALRGSSDAETARLRKTAWNAYKAEVGELPDDAVITDSVLEGIIGDIAKAMGGSAEARATKAAKEKIERTKKTAGKAAQSFVRERTPRKGRVASAEDAYDQGGARGLLGRFLRGG